MGTHMYSDGEESPLSEMRTAFAKRDEDRLVHVLDRIRYEDGYDAEVLAVSELVNQAKSVGDAPNSGAWVSAAIGRYRYWYTA